MCEIQLVYTQPPRLLYNISRIYWSLNMSIVLTIFPQTGSNLTLLFIYENPVLVSLTVDTSLKLFLQFTSIANYLFTIRLCSIFNQNIFHFSQPIHCHIYTLINQYTSIFTLQSTNTLPYLHFSQPIHCQLYTIVNQYVHTFVNQYTAVLHRCQSIHCHPGLGIRSFTHRSSLIGSFFRSLRSNERL